jgi:hypothetical protein
MSRKFLVTIVLILFLLPFVSWYYLQSGLNWRKKAQEVMNGNEPFPADTIRLQDGRYTVTDSLTDHVTLVGFVDCQTTTEQVGLLEQLYQQFKETNKAKFLVFDTCATSGLDDFATGKRGVYSPDCTINQQMCSALISNWPVGKTYALVDRKGIIRSYYSVAGKEEKKLLVEHMSLLLPRERQEKVELKRGEQK